MKQKQPGAPQKGKEQRKKTQQRTQQRRTAKHNKNNTAEQHGASSQPDTTTHSTPGTTQNTPQAAAPHNAKHDKAQQRTPTSQGGGKTSKRPTGQKKEKNSANNPRGRGWTTPNGSHQRQHGEEQRCQLGAIRHAQHNRQQHKRRGHRHGALNDRTQAHSSPRRSTMPITTHTNTLNSTRHTNPRTAHPAHHGTEKKRRKRKKKGGRKKGEKNKQEGKKKHARGGREGKKEIIRTEGRGANSAKAQGTQGRKPRHGGGAPRGKKKQEQPQAGQTQPGGARANRESTKNGHRTKWGAPKRAPKDTLPDPAKKARTRNHTRGPAVASSDPTGAVSSSTRNSPGALAGSPVERRMVRKTGRVSDRVHTRKPPQRTQPKTDAGGTRQG